MAGSMTRQFENDANPAYHAKTTAQEILKDFDETLDYWVTGFGTGGTLKGVGGRAQGTSVRGPRSSWPSRRRRRC